MQLFSKNTPPINRLYGRRIFRKCPEPTLSDDCWVWTGGIARGYGKIKIRSKNWYVHVLSYTLHKGPIPEGLELDHLCHVRACFNPNHLEPVTHQINVSRGNVGLHEISKTHCINGHEYTEENTRWRFEKNRIRCRDCIICLKAQWKRSYTKKKAKIVD